MTRVASVRSIQSLKNYVNMGLFFDFDDDDHHSKCVIHSIIKPFVLFNEFDHVRVRLIQS